MPINENIFSDIITYMPDEKFYGMLGLARNAGCLKTGAAAVQACVRSNAKPHLVIIADNASDNTKRDMWGLCHHYGVPFITVMTGERLGESVGSAASVKLAAVTEKGFAEMLTTLVAQYRTPDDRGANRRGD